MSEEKSMFAYILLYLVRRSSRGQFASCQTPVCGGLRNSTCFIHFDYRASAHLVLISKFLQLIVAPRRALLADLHLGSTSTPYLIQQPNR